MAMRSTGETDDGEDLLMAAVDFDGTNRESHEREETTRRLWRLSVDLRGRQGR